MQNSHQFQYKKRMTNTTALPTRPLSTNLQANPEPTRNFGHSLERISIQHLEDNGIASNEIRKANATGLPDHLKTGIETLSGLSLDDVRVHYNSPQPADVQALAYTQGTEIHVGPGQEQHLAHEAWHVVQQKLGRVQPTRQIKGKEINDNEGLEKEADVMGTKAASTTAAQTIALPADHVGEAQDTIGSQAAKQLQAIPLVIQRVESGLNLDEDDGGEIIIKKVVWRSKGRTATNKKKQGDHVFPFEAVLDTMENRLRGLTLATAGEDLINYAEGLTEMPGYEVAPSWYKEQLTNWISDANGTDLNKIGAEDICTWIDQLVGYRNMLPLTVTTMRYSSKGHGEAQKVGNLAYWDELFGKGELARKDCASDPIDTAWEVCDYHPTDGISDKEIGGTLAQFILSMEWGFPHLFANDDAMCGDDELRAKLDDVIDNLLDRITTDVDTRKTAILKCVDDALTV